MQRRRRTKEEQQWWEEFRRDCRTMARGIRAMQEERRRKTVTKDDRTPVMAGAAS